LQDAEAIVIGGGNTWRLLQQMQEKDLLGVIREKVIAGTPYVGWSAGSNVSCPTISTTNDMPAVVPHGFEALHLVDFQINPHYLDANPAGHAGETREERIIEYIELNRDMTVVGLREGTMLRIESEKTDLIGKKPARIFHYGATQNLNEAVSVLSKTVEYMCIGEIEQDLNRYKEDISEEKYFEIIEKKTAALFQAACHLGAKEAACPDSFIEKLELILFGAERCKHCKALHPIIEKVLESNLAKYIKAKYVDVDKNLEITERYKVQGIPVIIITDGEKELSRKAGEKSYNELYSWIEDLINKNVK